MRIRIQTLSIDLLFLPSLENLNKEEFLVSVFDAMIRYIYSGNDQTVAGIRDLDQLFHLYILADKVRLYRTYLCQRSEVVCTVRLAVGFLLVLTKWCAQSRLAIGFWRCFGFTKPKAFFPLNITTGSLIAQSFFSIYINNYFFSIFWDILIAIYEFAKKM